MGQSLAINGNLVGQRLDAALASLAPPLSLRARRRLIENGTVLVNGKPGRAGQRLRASDVVDVLDAADQSETSPQSGPHSSPGYAQDSGPDSLASHAFLVSIQGDYAILAKPAGLHSASLAGGKSTTLEAQLPRLLPEYPHAQLLQRLDLHTSGLVCAALSTSAATAFRQWERRGQCEKRYVALLRGTLTESFVATHAIDTDQRLKSRVTVDEAPPLRHTQFVPLAHGPARELVPGLGEGLDDDSPVTLTGCVIRMGCRHQIRAHAAHAGHPLLGDGLYDALSPTQATTHFFLHAGAIAAPQLRCTLPPPWELAPQARVAAEKWFENVPRYGITSSVV